MPLILATASAAPTLSPADAVATGDCAGALEGLPASADRSGPQRVAAGWCLLETGDPEAALAALDGDTAPLDGYAAWLQGRAAFELERPDDAAQALASVTLPGDLQLRARLLRARALLASGAPDGRAALQALTTTDLGPEARFWLAQHDGDDDLDALVAGLEEVWTDARPGGWDARAEAHLIALDRMPDLSTEHGRAVAERRLADLHRRHRNEDALALAEALRAGEEPADRAGWMTLGSVHWKARSYEGALDAWGHALGPPAEAIGSAEELFDYALCHARTGDYDTAAVVYERVMAQHPGTSQADFASYKRGYMEYDRRDCDAAVPLFDAHIEALPGSEHLDEALWFQARCHWRGGDIDAAEAALKRLEDRRPRSSLRSGAAYWQARARGVAGDADAERAGLQRVLRSWPTSGYAWFAAARLGHTFAPEPAAEPPPWPASMAQSTRVVRAEALLGVGLRAWARAELAGVSASGGRAGTLALAWARIRAGDYRGGKKLACPLAASPWKEQDPVALQACHPRPEVTIVERVRGDAPLHPAVPYGVMIAESALQPEVTSPAGARGLMQLMPEVGATLHERVWPHRPYDDDDLYRGPYNATLGTLELVDRTRSLEGVLAVTSLPAVIASYNGGEEAVRRWLEPFEEPPPFDAWSEDVGYTETRRYIKRVLGFSMRYRWVYGDPPG